MLAACHINPLCKHSLSVFPCCFMSIVAVVFSFEMITILCVCVCSRTCVTLLSQIRPYVNGALYSILSIPSVRQEAREMVR